MPSVRSSTTAEAAGEPHPTPDADPRTGPLIALGEMVRWHGTGNALCLALPALLAFRFAEA